MQGSHCARTGYKVQERTPNVEHSLEMKSSFVVISHPRQVYGTRAEPEIRLCVSRYRQIASSEVCWRLSVARREKTEKNVIVPGCFCCCFENQQLIFSYISICHRSFVCHRRQLSRDVECQIVTL